MSAVDEVKEAIERVIKGTGHGQVIVKIEDREIMDVDELHKRRIKKPKGRMRKLT